MSEQQHEPTIVELYAAHLAGKAAGIVNRWIVGVGLVCAGLGAVPLTSWADWPITHRAAYGTVVLGALAGGILGRSIGSSRASGLRLQAQLVVHQDELERTALAVVRAAGHPQAAPVAPAPAAAPATTEPPLTAPAPCTCTGACPGRAHLGSRTGSRTGVRCGRCRTPGSAGASGVPPHGAGLAAAVGGVLASRRSVLSPERTPRSRRMTRASPSRQAAGIHPCEEVSALMPDTVTITDNRTGQTYEVPVEEGAIRASALRQIKVDEEDFGLLSYDPAFMNTASVPERDHVHRRRQGDPPLPRLPDRAARPREHLSRDGVPHALRRAADSGRALRTSSTRSPTTRSCTRTSRR